jgi:hypothetical protein
MIKTKTHHEQQTKTKIIPVTKQSKQNTKLTKTQYLHTNNKNNDHRTQATKTNPSKKQARKRLRIIT